MFKRAVTLTLGALVCSSAAEAQTAASRFALAIVTDPRGKVIVDIGADDFVVQEAAAVREVLDVRVADYPVAIVIDNAAADADFAMIRAAVLRLLERLGPRPVALITAGDAATLVASFEDERSTVKERLEQIEAAPSRPSRPLAAAALAGQTVKALGSFFAAVIIATASPPEAATAELTAPIVDSRAVVHVVAYRREPGDAPDAVRAMATQTQGDYTAIYSAASFVPALDHIAARLTSEMLIEYIVPVGSKPVDVKIGVRLPGARVRGLGVAPK